jgi:hypothetical protein
MAAHKRVEDVPFVCCDVQCTLLGEERNIYLCMTDSRQLKTILPVILPASYRNIKIVFCSWYAVLNSVVLDSGHNISSLDVRSVCCFV